MVSTTTTVNRSLLMVAYFSFTAGDEQDYTLTYRTTHPDWRWCHAMYAPDEVEIPDEALLYDPANPPYAMLLRETGESLSLTDTEVIGGSRTRAIGLLIVPTLAVFGNVLALVVRLLP